MKETEQEIKKVMSIQEKKQSEPIFEWKWQPLCKLMKNTGKSRREGTVNIMSLFHHFGANHPLKFPKVGGEVVNRDFFFHLRITFFMTERKTSSSWSEGCLRVWGWKKNMTTSAYVCIWFLSQRKGGGERFFSLDFKLKNLHALLLTFPFNNCRPVRRFFLVYWLLIFSSFLSLLQFKFLVRYEKSVQ